MIPTVQYLQQKFSEFNSLMFAGELPPIPIVLTRAKTFGGKYVFGRYQLIEISTYRDLPEREIQDTLIHEMIHYYIHYKKLKDTSPHGKIFRQMMNNINIRYGRNLTVSIKVKSDDNVAQPRISAHYICVSTFKSDGHRGITVCAKTRIFEIHKILTHANVIKSIEWFGSTDTFFNKYPNSQTAKVYQISEQDLAEHLKDAIPLVCDGKVIKPK